MMTAVVVSSHTYPRPPDLDWGDDAGALSAMPAPTRQPPTMSAEAAARFKQMVEAQFDFIWRSLRGLGVPSSTADDAAQQVFWVAAQKIDAIAPGSERSFLFATARGIAANVRRAGARSRETLDDRLALHVDAAPNPEQLATSKQALQRILGQLPEELREVFVLFELEGMSTAEMAELLAIPMGTVASRLRRAREDFQAAARRFELGRKGGV